MTVVVNNESKHSTFSRINIVICFIPCGGPTVICFIPCGSRAADPLDGHRNALQFGVTDGSRPDQIQCQVVKIIVKHSFEISTFLFFALPMTVITVLYALIGLRLRRSALLKKSSGSFSHHQEASRSACRSTSSKRVLKMLVAVVVAFFICWAPFHAQRLVAIYGVHWNEPVSPLAIQVYTVVTYFSGILYYVSTTVNPILYHIMSLKFREAFKNSFPYYLAPSLSWPVSCSKTPWCSGSRFPLKVLPDSLMLRQNTNASRSCCVVLIGQLVPVLLSQGPTTKLRRALPSAEVARCARFQERDRLRTFSLPLGHSRTSRRRCKATVFNHEMGQPCPEYVSKPFFLNQTSESSCMISDSMETRLGAEDKRPLANHKHNISNSSLRAADCEELQRELTLYMMEAAKRSVPCVE
ncbi:neuromedin U receptor activity protein [Homalodisca vitripennis]|nr:neuromedin U receptor activity protein [Homalodisca vitripennis]